MQAQRYGVHLTCLMTDIEKRLQLNCEEVVGRFLCDLVAAAGMRILAGPLTGREIGDAAHEGVSGVVILYESHAAVHTYPAIGAAFVDIFSCKSLAETDLNSVFDRYFGSYSVQEKH